MKIMRYSYSRIRCFERCPRAFKMQYIDKVDVEEFETIEAFMGKRVHDALEMLYRKKRSVDIPFEDELISFYNEEWKKHMGPEIVINKDQYTGEDYRKTGEGCLREYYSRHYPFDRARTLSTEMRIHIDLLGDGQYKFIGFIDRLDVRGGIYEIHDYKTSRRLPSQNKKDNDRQLALYELGLRQAYENIKRVDLVWHYLLHNKEIRSQRSKEELENLKEDLLGTIHAIERAVVDDHFPAIRTGLCNWCEFQEICMNGEYKGNGKGINGRQVKLSIY